MKKALAAGVAVLGLAVATAVPAFAAGTTVDYYSSKSQGHWGQKWWDNNSGQNTISVKNVNGCNTTVSGEKSVTYRMHKLNGILPADRLGDKEFLCTLKTNRNWSNSITGNHEYAWQIVQINGYDSGGKATATNVTSSY